MNIKRLTTLAMLIGVYVVLGNLTLSTLSFKFTLEAFPVLVASLLLGPVDGLIVGGVGSLIYQVLFSGYGITATTLLWVIPHAVSGFIVGCYGKAKNHSLSFRQIAFIAIVSSLIVTGLNTIVMILDAIIMKYSYSYVFINLITRIIVGIILAIIYSLVLPRLLNYLKKIQR